MKNYTFLIIPVILIITGCSPITSTDTSPNASAKLAFNVDEIHLRSVDGKPFKYNPSNPFASNKLKVTPGKHNVAATLHWVGSLNGRNFTTQTENTTKKTCFIAEAGKSYVVVARFNDKGWYPLVISTFGLMGSKNATPC